MGELATKNCPVCFIDYAIPKRMDEKRRQEGGSWFCPNGHSLSYTESENDKLRRERDRLKQDQAWYSQRLDSEREARALAERRASAARGQVTKLKKRAANGVCPCCNRTFVNLARHMASQHPTFAADDAAPEGATIQ